MSLSARVRRIIRPRYAIEETPAIYATNVLTELANSLLGIFVPIFIFEQSHAYPVFFKSPTINGFLWIIAYYLLTSLTVVISIALLESIIFKLTLKKTMFLSKLALTLSYVFLAMSQHNLYWVLLSAVFSGIHSNLYWIPYHIFFVKRADDGDGKYGKETGRRDFYVSLATSFGPLLGSLIIARFSFSGIYAFAVFIQLFSTLPIILFVQEEPHRPHAFKDVYRNYLLNKKYRNVTLAFSGWEMEGIIYTIFWSLLLYLGLHSLVDIGVLSTLSSIVAMVLLVLIGRWIDSHGKENVHTFGVVLNTLIHVVRPFFVSPIFLYVNGTIDSLNSPLYSVPFNALMYEKSLRGSVSDYIIYREVAMHTTRVFLLLLVALALIFTQTWKWTFFVACLGSLMTLLIH